MLVRSLAAAVCSAVLLFAAPAAPFAAEAPGQWTTAWATAPQSIPQGADLPALYRAPDVAGRTVRQIVYPTLSGSAVRVRVDNAYGKAPLVIEEMSVARAGAGARTQGDAVRVTFGGKRAVTVPPGGALDSDAVHAEVVAGAAYAISTYMGAGQSMTAWHRVSSQVNYVSLPGNHVQEASADAYRQRFTQYAWITGLMVERSASATVAVAAVGDSITDGMRSSLNANRRWPDALARRLSQAGDRSIAVLNLGVSGNRLLSDSPCYGDALQSRFHRDVLEQPGVRTAILLIGINDINFASMPPHAGLDCDTPHTQVTAASLIEGYRRVIAAAHARGVRVIGATLTPASLPSQRESTRLAVNQWIRTGRAYDGVVDFDAALRDPAYPSQLRRAFDSGDHIHPNDAGYAAMADAIPLQLLTGATR
ncbi:SGNH/GDSL hydrolase family protein [Paraburkholderia sp. SARCC-3016]|uniref:SGNH/GDSL hydrolase family protein n=1 Tax=Paraburkholderia sp. SARCC-3016 TaxID=3058611 RepID=UPI00280A49E7|nr:SGNH/GDSL hydrolase family protein [Paraburkholderia sp. SARCC-3016]MDQ7980892.1 SGNH/GDSL hydrolase family protein [Paraburkholderia sp. SARCC-3016]